MSGVETLDMADLTYDAEHRDGVLGGYVYHPAAPARRWSVELLIDGWPIEAMLADRHVPRMERSDAPGDCGFAFDLREARFDAWSVIEARLANHHASLGRFNAGDPPKMIRHAPGAVAWAGGLRLSGWVEAASELPSRVRAVVDGDIVAEAEANRAALVEENGLRHARFAFDLHLPERLADGRRRLVNCFDEAGRALASAPVAVVAYPQGLARSLSGLALAPGERLAAETFDKLWPGSAPLRLPGPAAEPEEAPASTASTSAAALVLVGGADPTPTAQALSASPREWVVGHTSGADGSFDFAAVRRFLKTEAAACDKVVFARSDGVLDVVALEKLLEGAASADVAYADVTRHEDGQLDASSFLPAFDYERLLEDGYAARCFAAPRRAVEQVGAAASLQALFLALLGADWRGKRIAHAPHAVFVEASDRTDAEAAPWRRLAREAAIAHLRERSISASVSDDNSGRPLVRRHFSAEAITAIVPVRGDPAALARCVHGLRTAQTRFQLEIILIETTPCAGQMILQVDHCRERGAIVLHAARPACEATALNRAVARASSRFLLFLDPGARVDGAVLDELAARLNDPSAGAAGPLLLSSSAHVIEAGRITCYARGVTAAMQGAGEGWFDAMFPTAHERSSLSLACCLARADAFAAAGGFDEREISSFLHGDDFFLRLRRGGRRVIMAPAARVTMSDTALLAMQDDPLASFRVLARARELEAFRARWGDQLDADPFYHPRLALNGPVYGALARPPRDCSPRFAPGMATGLGETSDATRMEI